MRSVTINVLNYVKVALKSWLNQLIRADFHVDKMCLWELVRKQAFHTLIPAKCIIYLTITEICVSPCFVVKILFLIGTVFDQNNLRTSIKKRIILYLYLIIDKTKLCENVWIYDAPIFDGNKFRVVTIGFLPRRRDDAAVSSQREPPTRDFPVW